MYELKIGRCSFRFSGERQKLFKRLVNPMIKRGKFSYDMLSRKAVLRLSDSSILRPSSGFFGTMRSCEISWTDKEISQNFLEDVNQGHT